MTREKQIELIRNRISVPFSAPVFPMEPEAADILSKEFLDQIDEAVLDAENDALEWVLREVFEVTP